MNMFSTAVQQSAFKVSVENDSLERQDFCFLLQGTNENFISHNLVLKTSFFAAFFPKSSA